MLVHSFNLAGFIQFCVGRQSSFTRPFKTHENRQKKKEDERKKGKKKEIEKEASPRNKKGEKNVYQCTHLFSLCGGFENMVNEFVIGIGGKSRDRGRLYDVWVFPLRRVEIW